MKLTIKREDLELDIDIEQLVKDNFLYKLSTNDEIENTVDNFLCGLDDEYYYNITIPQREELYKEVKDYIDNMEDYTLLDVCKRIVDENEDLRIENGHYEYVDIIPLLKYLIKKEEGK